MTGTAMLFGLPTDLGSAMFSDWLIMRDLVFLDTACCSRPNREALMRLYSCEHCFADTAGTEITLDADWYPSYLKWLLNRGLSPKSLQLSDSCASMIGQEEKLIAVSRKTSQLSVTNLTVDLTAALIRGSEKLTHLEIVGEYRELESTAAAISCPQLRELKVDGGRLVTWIKCPNLTVLELRNISYEDVSVILKQLFHFHVDERPVLLTLTVSNINDLTETHLDKILAQNRQLTKLTVENCKVSEAAFGRIAEWCPQIKQLTFLENSNAHIDAVCQNIRALAASCRNLKSLYLGSQLDECVTITDSCLYVILVHIPTLEDLTLENCSQTKGLINLPSCTELGIPSALQKLSFKSCYELQGLMNIFSLCPCLRDLSISAAHAISESAYSYIFSHGTTLENLELSWQLDMKLEGLHVVPHGNLPRLQALNLEYSYAECGLDTAFSICPNVRDLKLSALPGYASPSPDVINLHYSTSLTIFSMYTTLDSVLSVIPMLKACSRMQRLKLRAPDLKCPEFYEAIAELPMLQYLELSNDQASGDCFDGLEMVLQRCAYLKEVVLVLHIVAGSELHLRMEEFARTMRRKYMCCAIFLRINNLL